jgi:hypothetical protein
MSKEEVNRIYGCRPDYGDAQLAYEILNMHATLAVPDPGLLPMLQFVNAINGKLALIWPSTFANDPAEDVLKGGQKQNNCQEGLKCYPNYREFPKHVLGSRRSNIPNFCTCSA